MTNKPPIEAAIERAGSEAKLGALTGYSQVAINKAKHKGCTTAQMAVAIERAVGVPKERLCPSVFVALAPSALPAAERQANEILQACCGEAQ